MEAVLRLPAISQLQMVCSSRAQSELARATPAPVDLWANETGTASLIADAAALLSLVCATTGAPEAVKTRANSRTVLLVI
jgi:seryl-tRNA(Sec) selenium transferase